jgi:hypothetical protein
MDVAKPSEINGLQAASKVLLFMKQKSSTETHLIGWVSRRRPTYMCK